MNQIQLVKKMWEKEIMLNALKIKVKEMWEKVTMVNALRLLRLETSTLLLLLSVEQMTCDSQKSIRKTQTDTSSS